MKLSDFLTTTFSGLGFDTAFGEIVICQKKKPLGKRQVSRRTAILLRFITAGLTQ